MLIRSNQIAVNILKCNYLNVNLSYVSVFSLGKIQYKIAKNSFLSSSSRQLVVKSAITTWPVYLCFITEE